LFTDVAMGRGQRVAPESWKKAGRPRSRAPTHPRPHRRLRAESEPMLALLLVQGPLSAEMSRPGHDEQRDGGRTLWHRLP
jgi:hypothetical protein